MKYKEIKTIKERENYIRELVSKDDNALWRGLYRIYQFQTASEQDLGETHMHNGVGFTGFDADFLSSLAEQYINNQFTPGSEKQTAYLRKAFMKYIKQLTKIADAENGIIRKSNSIIFS